MSEDVKIELERAKMRNYLLEKENEILLGNLGCLAREKKELLEQIKNIQDSRSYRIIRKIRKVVRRA